MQEVSKSFGLCEALGLFLQDTQGLVLDQICELLQQCTGLHTVCLVIDNADDLVHAGGQADVSSTWPLL